MLYIKEENCNKIKFLVEFFFIVLNNNYILNLLALV